MQRAPIEIQEVAFIRKNIFYCDGSQTLEQITWGGCGISVLEILRTLWDTVLRHLL